MISKGQESVNLVTIITHHGLIKLLVRDTITIVGKTQDILFYREHVEEVPV